MRLFPRFVAATFGMLLVSFTLGTGDALAKKDKGGDSADAPAEFVEIGIADMDSLFNKAKALNDSLVSAKTDIATANANIVSVLGLPEGTPVADALADLKGKAAGNLKIAMEGTMPRVTASDAVPQNVKDAVEAVNGTVGALTRAVKTATEIPGQAKDIVEEAKTLPGKAPAMLKDAGVSPKELPAKLKAVKGNVKATTGIPGNAEALVTECNATLDIVKGLAD